MRKGKVPGHDEVTGEVTLKESESQVLLNLLNQIRKEKRIPKYWLGGVVCAIYRKGDEVENLCENTRDWVKKAN